MKLSLMWDRAGAAPSGWLRHIPVQWSDIEGWRGQYGFRRVDEWLANSDAPAFLAFQFATANRSRNELKDLTPTFHKRSLVLTSGALTGEIPPYGDATWRKALYAAVDALALYYRCNPQVAGYFWGAGVNDETQAITNWPGADWGASLKAKLPKEQYYDFIEESTARAVAVWQPKRVYLSGAPAPGWPWGTRGKTCIVNALRAGAGYRCCGLKEDIADAVGLGGHVGTGMYDIAMQAPFCAFEGGLNDGTGQPPMRLYWMLLHALHYGADHVNLQDGWIPAAAEVYPLMPTGAHWIVFRNYEAPPIMYGSYGRSGTPGCFGQGFDLTPPGTLLFTPDKWGYDRWTYTAASAWQLKTTLADGRYTVTVWRPTGAREDMAVTVSGGRMALPAGSYHRLDVIGASEPPPPPALTLEERVTRLEKLHGI